MGHSHDLNPPCRLQATCSARRAVRAVFALSLARARTQAILKGANEDIIGTGGT